MRRDVSGHLSRGLAVLVGAVLAVACVPPYRPPTASEPHAVVKFRRSYDEVRGAQLREVVDLDEYRAYSGTTPAGANDASHTDVVLVHPGPVSVAVASKFFHVESRRVREQYTERTPYQEHESYDCSTGFGTERQYRRCSRMVTKYKNETKYRWVTKQVEVSDGDCVGRLRFAPADQRVYLVQYSYHGHAACNLSCFEQVFDASRSGEFETRPCAPAPRRE